MLLHKILEEKDSILDIFDKYSVIDVRIIGSVSIRDEKEHSDIDFVANFGSTPDLIKYGLLKKELESYFKRKIDLGIDKQIKWQYPNAYENGVKLTRDDLK